MKSRKYKTRTDCQNPRTWGEEGGRHGRQGRRGKQKEGKKEGEECRRRREEERDGIIGKEGREEWRKEGRRRERGQKEAERLILELYRRNSIHFKICEFLHNREQTAKS